MFAVAIVGVESTGKSTLAEDLAKYYQTEWIAEFARKYLENLGRNYTYDDVLLIAQNQNRIIQEKIKENTEDENYDDYINEYRIQSIVKKYSDFIRYPIKMDIAERRPKPKLEGEENADDKPEFEYVVEEKTINSMVPIWRKNKSELTQEDYENFYAEKHYGFDKPLKHIHISVDGAVRYNAILFIPENMPFDYYTKEFEKGLELYS
ncbi:MAG: AAA family ATPase, partial [Raineya sp.]